MGQYSFIDHTADLGIDVTGTSFDDLLTTIARAMFETQIKGILEYRESKHIECTGDTWEDLLVDWCRELLYLYAVHEFIPMTYRITLNDRHLSATVEGDHFNKTRHTIVTEIKNVTYHDLKIEKTRTGYHTTVIFDV
jgi:SHS2 domain-containing protein